MGLIKLGQKLGERLKQSQERIAVERVAEKAQKEILKEKLKQARFTEQIKQAEILGKARAKAQFRPAIQATRPKQRRQVSATAFEDLILGGKPQQPQQPKQKKGLSKKQKKKLKKQIKRVIPTPSPKQTKQNLNAIGFAGAVD